MFAQDYVTEAVTSSYDTYSCILRAERALKPYVQASYNCRDFHFYGALLCAVGRASPACSARGRRGAGAGAQSSILGLGCGCWASKGEASPISVDEGKETAAAF